eukprot:29085_1
MPFIGKKLRILLEIYQYFWDEYILIIRMILKNKKGFGGKNFKHWYIGEKGYWFKIGEIITEYVIEDYRKDYKYYRKIEDNMHSEDKDKCIANNVRYLLNNNGFDLYKLWDHCGTCSGWESFEINKVMDIKLKQEQELNDLEYNKELIELAYYYKWNKNKFLSKQINKKWLNKHVRGKQKKRKNKECIVVENDIQQNVIEIIQSLIRIFKRDEHKYPWNSFLNNEYYGNLNIESDDSELIY